MLVAAVAAVLLAVALVVGVRVLGDVQSRVDPSTRPAQDRPGTVLLVPGYGGSRDSLAGLADRIRAGGRDAKVITLVGDGTGDLAPQVRVLDQAVDAALAAGAPSVDVVGYSAGGVVAGLWVARHDGAARARRVVAIGSPLHGARVAGVGAAFLPDACPVACRQLAPGSAEINELVGAGVGGRLPWLSLWTTDDETVMPADSARLDGALNVELQQVCAGVRLSHSGLPRDPLVTGLVLRAISAEPLTAPGTADCGPLRAAGAA